MSSSDPPSCWVQHGHDRIETFCDHGAPALSAAWLGHSNRPLGQVIIAGGRRRAMPIVQRQEEPANLTRLLNCEVVGECAGDAGRVGERDEHVEVPAELLHDTLAFRNATALREVTTGPLDAEARVSSQASTSERRYRRCRPTLMAMGPVPV